MDGTQASTQVNSDRFSPSNIADIDSLVENVSSLLEAGAIGEVRKCLCDASIALLRESVWQLTSLACTFITGANQRDYPNRVDAAVIVMTRLVTCANPSELLILLLEQIEGATNNVSISASAKEPISNGLEEQQEKYSSDYEVQDGVKSVDKKDETNNDLLFITLLPLLQRCLLRISEKRKHTFGITLETIYKYINCFDVPASSSFDADEYKLFENDEPVFRLLRLIEETILFITPFVCEVEQVRDFEVLKSSVQFVSLLKFLLLLLNHPFCPLFLASQNEASGTKNNVYQSKSFLLASKVVSLLSKMHLDLLRIVNFIIDSNTQILYQNKIKTIELEASENIDHVENNDSNDLEEEIPEAGIAVLLYLVFAEGCTFSELPLVYRYEHIFIKCTHYISILLQKSDAQSMFKGVSLLHATVSLLPDARGSPPSIVDKHNCKISCANDSSQTCKRYYDLQDKFILWKSSDIGMPASLVDLPSLENMLIELVKLAAQSPTREIAVALVNVIPIFLHKFDEWGRFRLIQFIFSSTEASGFLNKTNINISGFRSRITAFAIQMLKDEIDTAVSIAKPSNKQCLREGLKENESGYTSPFLGFNLNKSLVKNVFRLYSLPDTNELDLFEEGERIMASLNMLRFLLIRDPPLDNITQIWKLNSTGLRFSTSGGKNRLHQPNDESPLQAHDELASYSNNGLLPYIVETFINPLRQHIQLSRAHFKLDLQKKTSDEFSPEVNISVNGAPSHLRDIDVGSESQEQFLKTSLHVFDLMDSLIARIDEIIDLQKN